MNYTKNYKLPQWVETDRIQMDDFNGAMETIEEGMSTAQETASTAKVLASAAQKTADDAASAARAAQKTADAAYSPSSKPVNYQSINIRDNTAVGDVLATFPFAPSVIIANTSYYPTILGQSIYGVVYNTYNATTSQYGIGILLNGTQLTLTSRGSNISSVTLRVIAFA